MGMLNNGMSILGLSSNLQQVVKGLVLLGAVAMDVISKMNLEILPRRKKVVVEPQKG
jgi:ABC-type xylose transport system permease subunit